MTRKLTGSTKDPAGVGMPVSVRTTTEETMMSARKIGCDSSTVPVYQPEGSRLRGVKGAVRLLEPSRLASVGSRKGEIGLMRTAIGVSGTSGAEASTALMVTPRKLRGVLNSGNGAAIETIEPSAATL